MAPVKVGIATEGRASAEVLEAICLRRGVPCKTLHARGKDRLFGDFDRMLMALGKAPFRAEKFLVVPDVHPERDCVTEARRWNEAIRERFPEARLCLAIWETEAWLIADPGTLRDRFGLDIKDTDPDEVGEPKPTERLEEAFRRARGYGRGSAFDKRADGVKIASVMNLEVAAKKSPSLRRFLRLLKD